MGEIAVGSEQQSQGIDQITSAVEQMNQLTQQNAANSEESASAAEELSSQSEELEHGGGVQADGPSSRKGSEERELRLSAAPGARVRPCGRRSAATRNGKRHGEGNGRNAAKAAARAARKASATGRKPEEVIPLDEDEALDF